MKIQERNVEMFCCVSGDMNSEKVHELGWLKLYVETLIMFGEMNLKLHNCGCFCNICFPFMWVLCSVRMLICFTPIINLY